MSEATDAILSALAPLADGIVDQVNATGASGAEVDALVAALDAALAGLTPEAV